VIEKQETAKRIKTFRRLQNLNQEDFASLLNVSKSRISQVENTGEISVDVYRKLKHLYPKLNLNWLMVGEGSIFINQEPTQAETGVVAVQESQVPYVAAKQELPMDGGGDMVALVARMLSDVQAQLQGHEGRLAALERALAEEGNQTT
jgi:transcriptional regulator with XRE-family HTH domain